MSHDSNHNTEKTPHFGPAVIMGLSFWVFAFFFLSLCDGKKEHGAHEASAEGHQAKTEQLEEVKGEPKAESSLSTIDSIDVVVYDSLGNPYYIKKEGVLENLVVEKLKEIKLLTDLVSVDEKDSKNCEWEIVGKVDGQVNIISGKGIAIDGKSKDVMAKFDVDSKLFLDVKTGKEPSTTKSFKFLITK